MSEKKISSVKALFFLCSREHSHRPLVKNIELIGHQYEEISLEKFCIKISSRNNRRDSCVGFKTNEVVIVENS